MKKREDWMISQIWRAFMYSLAFCMRSGKAGTITRFVVSGVLSITGFLLLYTLTHLVNVAQQNWNVVSTEQIPNQLLVALAQLGAVALVMEGAQLASWYTNTQWQQKMRFANRRELDEHFATLDVARATSKEFDELKRLIDDLPMSWGVRIALVDGMLNLFGIVISFLCFGASLFLVNPLYACIILVTSLPLLVYQFKDTARWWKLTEDLVPVHKERSVPERAFRGNVTAFKQAILFGQFPWLRKEIDTNVASVLSKYAAVRWSSLWWGVFVSSVSWFGYLLVLYLALVSMWATAGAVGTLVLIFQATRTMYNDIERIVSVLAEQWQAVRAVIKIEEDFLAQEPLLVKGGDTMVHLSMKGKPITLQNVTFAYPNTSTAVMQDVTVSIPAGKKVAVVGANGSGKTTLLSLLMRHYDPTTGRVMVGNTPLSEISPAQLSRYVTALTQGHVIMPRSIGQEIASSRLSMPYDMDRAKQAASLADFTQVLDEFPQGLGTQIGVDFGGKEFSGGQAQRLALARSLYALGEDTSVLLLDEPEAALDPESAERVIQNILALQEVTVIMVTHFVQRALDFDLVLVMDQGRLVEYGSPREVAMQGGIFARLLSSDTKRRGGE